MLLASSLIHGQASHVDRHIHETPHNTLILNRVLTRRYGIHRGGGLRRGASRCRAALICSEESVAAPRETRACDPGSSGPRVPAGADFSTAGGARAPARDALRARASARARRRAAARRRWAPRVSPARLRLRRLRCAPTAIAATPAGCDRAVTVPTSSAASSSRVSGPVESSSEVARAASSSPPSQCSASRGVVARG